MTAPTPDPRTPGQVAYERRYVGCPPWSSLPPELKSEWDYVAFAVLAHDAAARAARGEVVVDEGMGNPRSADDYTDAGCRVLAEHAFRDIAALLAEHPEPRVWRAGDDEPGEDVLVVLDAIGFPWVRRFDEWATRWSNRLPWDVLVRDCGPLVEVTLPPVVSG